MSTPTDSLGKDARALLRAARGGDDVPPQERRRLLEAFARQRAAEQAPARVERAVAPLGWRSRRAAPRLGWAMAALVLTGSLAALARHQGILQRLGAWLEAAPAAPAPQSAGKRQGAGEARAEAPRDAVTTQGAATPPSVDPPPSASPAPRPQPPAPIEPRSSAPQPAQRSSGSRRSSPVVRAPAQRTPPSVPDAIDPMELELIAAARTALAERRHDAAREHAARHAARFPRGAFSEEREAILALSDCRERHGNQRGQRFLSERPGSLLAERVRRDCGLSSNLVPGAREPDTH